MPLPAELLAPPPRDVAAAQKFLAKSRKTAFGVLVGGAALTPLLLLMMWLKFGALDGLALGISLGVGGLVELMGAALLFNSGRAATLFRDGAATLGTVRKVTAPADNQGNAYVLLEVAFIGSAGPRHGKVTLLGNTRDIDTREGAEIAVLYSPIDAKPFAVYTPGLGMSVGVSTEA